MKISGISPKWIERMANNVRCNNDVRHCQIDNEKKIAHRTQTCVRARNTKAKKKNVYSADKYFMRIFMSMSN